MLAKPSSVNGAARTRGECLKEASMAFLVWDSDRRAVGAWADFGGAAACGRDPQIPNYA
jgi:hypothetical protein